MEQNPVDILLVEDNPSDVVLMTHALESSGLGARLLVARDGQEAVDLIFGRGPTAGPRLRLTPRVIFLDLNLPKISGLEVLRWLRLDSRTRAIPVVVLTSSREERDLMAN